MIDQQTGMKPGERYAIENGEPTRLFPGFFLDGKYYLEPELQTAIGWLEGQRFLYDELDPTGEPVYPDRVAGTIEDLTLTLADGARLKVNRVPYSVQGNPLTQKAEAADDELRTRLPRTLHDEPGVIDRATDADGRAASQAFAAAPRPSLVLAAGAALLFGGCLLAMNRQRGRHQGR
ncbi:hypothetical protein J2W17_002447 [Pseudomonas lini]|uniref:short chain dehydrogenase n=1 Tax=Pseudomonas lini TaxID=163011 RepID=UPI00278BA37E|nr:short chain dehydrogenase [Pseudomonas lini]MDQ0123500.1 hypothetical protein [Pseudomonas lini]